MTVWEEYAGKLADKLMDAGNIVLAALIVGQIVAGKLDWVGAAVSGAAWLGLYTMAYLALYWGRRGGQGR